MNTILKLAIGVGIGWFIWNRNKVAAETAPLFNLPDDKIKPVISQNPGLDNQGNKPVHDAPAHLDMDAVNKGRPYDATAAIKPPQDGCYISDRCVLNGASI